MEESDIIAAFSLPDNKENEEDANYEVVKIVSDLEDKYILTQKALSDKDFVVLSEHSFQLANGTEENTVHLVDYTRQIPESGWERIGNSNLLPGVKMYKNERSVENSGISFREVHTLTQSDSGVTVYMTERFDPGTGKITDIAGEKPSLNNLIATSNGCGVKERGEPMHYFEPKPAK